MTESFSRYPPVPVPGESWRTWATRLKDYLSSGSAVTQRNEPRAVQLLHKVGSASAADDGILMYDPETDDALISIDGIWERLANHKQVLDNFVFAAYGGVRMPSETADADISSGWFPLDAMSEQQIANRGVTVSPPGTIQFQTSGVYQINAIAIFSHNETNQSRRVNFRLSNITAGQPDSNIITLGTGRNTDVTGLSLSSLVEVTEAQVGDTFRLEVGGGSTYSSVSWLTQTLSVSGAGEYRGDL